MSRTAAVARVALAALVHLAGRPDPVFVGGAVCSCGAAASASAFRRCVRRAGAQERPASRRELKRLAARAACGRTTAPPGTVACCLPVVPEQTLSGAHIVAAGAGPCG